MNFSISLSDELSEKIILKAAENNITHTHYIEMLINSIIIDNPNANQLRCSGALGALRIADVAK